HVIAAKAVAFWEALQPGFTRYVERVRANARRLGVALADRGYQLATGGTDNHLLLIDLRNKGLTGKEAETILGKVHITVNKNMVPFDDKSPFVTSGIRLGTAAVTTRGLREEDMDQLAEWIDEALRRRHDDHFLSALAQEVEQKMLPYPLFQYE
ncbi:MAG: serine hydroxymethyltransferase, partial [Chitinophagales bacterium]|nr:serine hydroxymethyltransferase [Chitinophagales bacterium]